MTETTRDVPLETPLGTVYVTAVAQGDVHVDANSNGKGLTLRGGARFGVSFNLIRQTDGTWAVYQSDGRPYVYTSRAWGQGGKAFDHATPFQREDMLKKVVPIVTAWADANLPARLDAEVVRCERDLEAAERAFAEAQEKFNEAKNLLHEASYALNTARLQAQEVARA